MVAILLAILVWFTSGLAIGGLMIWRPIPVRKACNEFRRFPPYVLN